MCSRSKGHRGMSEGRKRPTRIQVLAGSPQKRHSYPSFISTPRTTSTTRSNSLVTHVRFIKMTSKDISQLLKSANFFHLPLSPSSRGSLGPLHFLLSAWCHLQIWGGWCFSQQSWWQLVITRPSILHDVLHIGASQVALVVRSSPANAGDVRDSGSIAGSGRSPGRGHGNPLQYSCLGISMERGAWGAIVHGVAESDTSEVT